ncbi:MAG: hypothetical protein M0T83_09145 [Nitrospiraceae bacterium]|nr:hypothetical protein [Nitrospiraceae bacterium]
MEIMTDNPDKLFGELSAILRLGSPSEALKEDDLSMRLSDILDILAEERELGVLADLPEMTPEWSLFIRNYLEISHDRFDLESEAGEEEGPDRESMEPGDAVFGLGLLVDLDHALPEALTLDALAPLAQLLETALSDSTHLVQVFLHPRVLSFADVYTFSYDSRRGFVEERLNFGFSMDSSGSLDEMPVMMAEALMGDWDQPAEEILVSSDPLLRSFGPSREKGRGALVGVVRVTPPYAGEWGEILDERFSGTIQEEVGEAISRVFDLSGPFEGEREPEEGGHVSLVPWSLLLPMAATIELGASLAKSLEEETIHPERVSMTPVWRDRVLWIEVEGRSPGNKPSRFLAVDEYVGQFMEHYVPGVMESMMGLSVRWNKRKGGGRFLSLGVV